MKILHFTTQGAKIENKAIFEPFKTLLHKKIYISTNLEKSRLKHLKSTLKRKSKKKYLC